MILAAVSPSLQLMACSSLLIYAANFRSNPACSLALLDSRLCGNERTKDLEYNPPCVGLRSSGRA